MPRAPRKRPRTKPAKPTKRPAPQPASVPYSLPTFEDHLSTYPHQSNEVRQAALSAEQSRLHHTTRGPDQPTSTSSRRQDWVELVVTELHTNESAYAPWIEANSHAGDEMLVEAIDAFFCTRPSFLPPVQRSSYISWLFRIITSHPKIPSRLLSAFQERHRRRAEARLAQRTAGLNYRKYTSPTAYAQFHQAVIHLWLKKLPVGKEYPTPGHWVAETEAIYDACHDYILQQKLADQRDGRYPVERMDRDQILRTIPPELTCLVFDIESKELVASVVRNFSQAQVVLDWAKEIIDLAVNSRKSARLEDPGSIVLIGFTAGARSRPIFGFARNLRKKNGDTTEADIKNASASAIFWKLVQMCHPAVVSADIEAFYRKYNIPRLDPNWPHSSDLLGSIMVPSHLGELVTLQDAELGPGCIVLCQNYARPVHFENQPHLWAASWTTLRTGTRPAGGNFFLPSYGLRIMQAQDTSIAWKPSDYHTTSLGSWDPKIAWKRKDDHTFIQQGMAIVTSTRIAPVFADWEKKNGLSGPERVDGAVADLESSWGKPEVVGFKPRK